MTTIFHDGSERIIIDKIGDSAVISIKTGYFSDYNYFGFCEDGNCDNFVKGLKDLNELRTGSFTLNVKIICEI